MFWVHLLARPKGSVFKRLFKVSCLWRSHYETMNPSHLAKLIKGHTMSHNGSLFLRHPILPQDGQHPSFLTLPEEKVKQDTSNRDSVSQCWKHPNSQCTLQGIWSGPEAGNTGSTLDCSFNYLYVSLFSPYSTPPLSSSSLSSFLIVFVYTGMIWNLLFSLSLPGT